MKSYAIAILLTGLIAAPAFALESGPYYVGLDTTTHTCSVMTSMKSGMKMMGKYNTKDEAEKAMADMKECKG